MEVLVVCIVLLRVARFRFFERFNLLSLQIALVLFEETRFGLFSDRVCFFVDGEGIVERLTWGTSVRTLKNESHLIVLVEVALETHS